MPLPGKSRGFAFLAYEDQRSTVLAVDNLSGGRVAGRIISVNHVDNYKVKRAEARPRGAPASPVLVSLVYIAAPCPYAIVPNLCTGMARFALPASKHVLVASSNRSGIACSPYHML